MQRVHESNLPSVRNGNLSIILIATSVAMPLLIISGYPCCGKSSYCLLLQSYLKSRGAKRVVVINEESENINKRMGYKEAFEEKKTRGALKSAVDHALDPECFVILDSMNYIKGYRYELFCISRSLRTPHCCVWVESDEAIAYEWNEARKQIDVNSAYETDTFIDLRRRFEAPIEKNRWDFPLFRVRVLIDPTLATTRTNVSECGGEELVDQSRVRVVQPVPLTSTKGQIDINCLTVDKVTKVEYRPEIVLDKVTAPISSSWRPKLRPALSMNTSRTFTTLSSDAQDTSKKTVSRNIDIHNNSSSNRVSHSTPLSISGSIPLIAPDDQALSQDVTMEMIYIHLTNVGQIAAPNSSTISVPRVNADLLHEIDRTTQNITQRIVTHQAENVEGTPLIFQDFDRTLALHRHVGLAELQRHRRQFVKTNSNMSQSTSNVLGSAFIDCLALNL